MKTCRQPLFVFRLMVLALTGLYFLAQEGFTQSSGASAIHGDEVILNNDTTLPLSVPDPADVQNPVSSSFAGSTGRVNPKISPNPVTSYGEVKFDNPDGVEYTVRIYNLLGEGIKDFTGIRSGFLRFETDDLRSGIYVLRLYQKSSPAGSARFIVQ